MSAIAVKRRKVRLSTVLLHTFFILLSLCYILPMLLVIATSFTSEDAILTAGFHIWPVEFSTAAYRMIFHSPTTIVRAYVVTFITAAAATLLSLTVTSLSAYPLSRSNFRFKKIFVASYLLSMLFWREHDTHIYHLFKILSPQQYDLDLHFAVYVCLRLRRLYVPHLLPEHSGVAV